MRPIITVTAVVLVHLCVIAVLVGVNGCRSTSGFEEPIPPAVFSGGARSATDPASTTLAPVNGVARIPTPEPTKLVPVTLAGPGGKYTAVKGDSLAGIAAREKVTRQALATANRLPLNAEIKPGQVLTIPYGGAPKAPVKTGAKTGAKSGAAPAMKAAPVSAEPAPNFTPLKIISLTNPAGAADTKPAAAVPATK